MAIGQSVIVVHNVKQIPPGYVRISAAARRTKREYGLAAAKIVQARLYVGARAGEFDAYKVARTVSMARGRGPVYVPATVALEMITKVVGRYRFPKIDAEPKPAPVVTVVPVSQPVQQPEQAEVVTPTPAPLLAAASTQIEKRIMAGLLSIWNRLDEIDKKLEKLSGQSEEAGIAPADLAAAIELVSETRRSTEQPLLVYEQRS